MNVSFPERSPFSISQPPPVPADQIYAVKELHNLTHADGTTDDLAMAELLEEVRKMGIVRSEYIVQYRTSAIFCDCFYVMMELIDGAEYRDVVVARQKGGAPFLEAQIVEWTRQIATGLAHLHDDCKLIHQDLHNGNVMVTGNLAGGDDALRSSTVKIIDLGLASFKSDHSHCTSTRMRTMRTVRMDKTSKRRSSCVRVTADQIGGFKAIRAPEMHPAAGGDGAVQFDAKTDIWALGILTSEAALLAPIEEWSPWGSQGSPATKDSPKRPMLQGFGRDKEQQRAKKAAVVSRSPRLGILVTRMIEPDPRVRPTASELLRELS